VRLKGRKPAGCGASDKPNTTEERMDLAKRFEHVTVIGAAGKMGSGISLLLAVEMTKRKLMAGRDAASFRLNVVDTNEDALVALADYIRVQAVKAAEKSIVQLRKLYADREDLVENGEIIREFAAEVGRRLNTSTDVAVARSSHMVFEAIVEDEPIKLRVYRKLKELCPADTFFFTNTSSIPIQVLDEQAELGGRIIGYHFYNPPAVQKLVELITSSSTRPELVAQSKELGKVLKKTLIPSNDIAGFIGNGHFIRDGLQALATLESLQADGMSFAESVYAVNRVTQDFLVRPMGIFQLLDYVGIDVFKCILEVMTRFLPGETLQSKLIDELVDSGVRGGQFSTGAQKDGLLKYNKGAIVGVYDKASGKYVELDHKEGGWSARLDSRMGTPPAGWMPWKKWLGQPNRDATLMPYLESLWGCESPGCKLARAHLVRSAQIARELVKSGVAAQDSDVNGVLLNGFFHAYGPINEVTRKHLGDSPETGKVSS
jgi:3-hydroxyacyl-CoA dehydrogenase